LTLRSAVVTVAAEVIAVSERSRRATLEQAGLVHRQADEVSAELFCSGEPFFLAADKVQVKYEMLRAVAVDGASVVAAAAAHGYSRAEFYLVAAAFAERGMAGLVDGRRGRKGPTKLTAEVATFLRAAPAGRSGAELVREVEDRFGVSLHRRTVERARHR
jgi:transposase